MKKESRQQKAPRRILGRILARELGDEELQLILAGEDNQDTGCGCGGPSTLLVTGMGQEDN
jgi:hypothetical protein